MSERNTEGDTRPGPTREDGPGLVNQVEGYLLWQARVAEAEDRARAFVTALDWLTATQRTEVEKRYIADCLARARGDLERIARRITGLRQEYEERYRLLRARCLAASVACTALALVAAVLLRCLT
ncbi:cytochrome C oxidase subunit I [Streptomyces griseoaurantiacus]|uniref:cytochrome C oxidase subunit I n=1 Tax=Streptomyces griseoaurantiacus TaxID=68213 RepID=UPI003251A3E9